MMGGAKRPGRDEHRAGAGEPGDAVDARGLKGLGESHRRQDGGEAPRQHRFARPRGAQEADVVGRTPASRSALPRLQSEWPQWALTGPWNVAPYCRLGEDNSSSNAFASWRSAVSKPSVNQP